MDETEGEDDEEEEVEESGEEEEVDDEFLARAYSTDVTAPAAKSFPAVVRAVLASFAKRSLRRMSSARATFSAAAISAASSAASLRSSMSHRI